MRIPHQVSPPEFYADHAPELRQEPAPERTFECDHCHESFQGEPSGAGLLLWTRGDEVRFEEPPLCEECAASITVGALMKWDAEAEEEG
jgi:hypothetical protein